jgi:hypothetical protein
MIRYSDKRILFFSPIRKRSVHHCIKKEMWKKGIRGGDVKDALCNSSGGCKLRPPKPICRPNYKNIGPKLAMNSSGEIFWGLHCLCLSEV